MKKIDTIITSYNDIEPQRVIRKANTPEGSALLKNENILSKSLDNVKDSFENGALMLRADDAETERAYIPGTPLGTRQELTIYEENIDKIAKNLAELRKFKAPKLPNDDFKKVNLAFINAVSNPLTLKYVWTKLKAPRYAKDVTLHDCKNLLKVANKSNISRQSFNHCEVSPWHMIKKDDDIYLIGWDWASNKFPEHYDVAHAAARLAVAYGKPDVATNLLDVYKECIKKEGEKQLNYFYETIDGLIAIRLIGELRDQSMSSGQLSDVVKDYINLAENSRC